MNQEPLLEKRQSGSCSLDSRLLVSRRCSTETCSRCQPPSVAVGLHATITRPRSIIAVGQPMTARDRSANPWLPSTTAGGHTVVVWVHSAIAWLLSTILCPPSFIARHLAMAKRCKSALAYAIFHSPINFDHRDAKAQRNKDSRPCWQPVMICLLSRRCDELLTDRADGKGLMFLAIGSTPNYADSAAMSPVSQRAVWKYEQGHLRSSRPVRRPMERCPQHLGGATTM